MKPDVLERLVRLMKTCKYCGDPSTTTVSWHHYCDAHVRKGIADVRPHVIYPGAHNEPVELVQAWAIRAVFARRRTALAVYERQAIACQLLDQVPQGCIACDQPATLVVHPPWCFLCDDARCHEAYATERTERARLYDQRLGRGYETPHVDDPPFIHYRWSDSDDGLPSPPGSRSLGRFCWRPQSRLADRGWGYPPAHGNPVVAPFRPLPYADTIREALVLVGAGF